VDGNSGLKFENSALAYQAAVDQLGIVMAQRAFVEDELRSGRLIVLLAVRAATAGAHYLAYQPSKRLMPLIRLFEPWILEQAARVEGCGGLTLRSAPCSVARQTVTTGA
jgi:LysR family glycine cleavage system transcriptional activator